MQLFSRIVGDGSPLIIVHGLFGMSDNWLTIGRELTRYGFQVHIPDLRNHGRSPHSDTHRYTDMADDLLEYVEEHTLDRFHLIGHSMGGKLAMIFSLLHPELVKKLVVVDIAPSDYQLLENSFHRNLIDTLSTINLADYSERGTLRLELENRLQDHRLAAFLAKNISRDIGNSFTWRFNLPVLKKYLHHIHIGLEELKIHAPCPVEALFIKGNDSNYYLPKHEVDRHFFFPNSKMIGIDNAGHWVHSEQSELFIQTVQIFLMNTGAEE